MSKTDTFTVDNEAPIPDVGENNGSTEPINHVSVTVNIPDAKDDTLEYLWSESKELDSVESVTAKGMRNSVTELNAWKPFKNGDTLTLEGQSGTYYLHVRGKDVLGNSIQWTSNAFNVDTELPAITLEGDNPLVIQAGTEYVEPGYTAIDNADGDLTSTVEVKGLESLDVKKPGEYVLIYTVSDTAGNSVEVQRKIHVVDKEKPYISLTDGTVEVEAGEEYIELGYTAIDNVDGDITAKVEVTGEVDISKPGEYTLTYTVTDSSDNSYSVTRLVKVIDTTAPNLALEGGEKIVIEGGTEYVESGYTATDIVDGNLTESVAVYGSVDVTKVGEYELKYHVIDSSGNEAIATRTVTVQDTIAPVIKLSGEDTITLDLGQAYLEPGFTATDTLDGNITDQVVVSGTLRFEVGTYTIMYTVTDAAGNESTAKRTVKVVDKTAPELTLKGSHSITLIKGEKYKEPGYKAKDNVDGNITDKVVISGRIDTNKVGAYTLTYTVADSSGNKISVERIIIVNEKPDIVKDDNDGSDNGTPSDSTKDGTANNGHSNGTKTTGGTNSSSGRNLPNTATSTYNWILAGVIIIVAGISLFIIQRRKKA